MSKEAKETMEIKVEEGTLEYLEALYTEYRAKQDVLNSIFELHKFDEDALVVNSAPFKFYEKEFGIAKVKYDKAMETIRETYIPKEKQEEGCKFEVDFENSIIKVTPL